MVGIKGTEMPKGCQYCRQFRKSLFGNGLDYSYSCMLGATEFPYPWIRQMEERASDCPLVEVKELKNVIEIPKGATNEDMIKAMFPNIETEYLDQHLIYPNGLYKSELKVKPYNVDEDNLVFVLRSLADWWNAPYESED